MQFFFAFATLAIVFTIVNGQTDSWVAFKKKHGKNYSGTSDAQRKQIFLNKDAQITKHNSQKNVLYKLGHNEFSDNTDAEMQARLGIKSVPKTRFLDAEAAASLNMEERALPATLDYRNDSCMPAIKNQKQCGSCWAFAATASLEFSRCKNNKTALVLLSEQQLVDCDGSSYGCNGGWYTTAWNYIKKVALGSAKGSLYPYTAKNVTCKFNTSMVAAKVSSFNYVATNNSVSMQTYLQSNGPLAVAITVVPTFNSYLSGIYNDPNCDNKNVNHAVNVVGYGTANATNYWVVRNSWGTGWGMSGYMLMQRGINKCSIERYAAYVVGA